MRPNVKKMELSGWGRYPRALCRVTQPQALSEIDFENEPRVIARGLGRSYGDAALSSDGLVMVTDRLNRRNSFEESTGVLTAEAGTTFKEILEAFVDRGWFPPVTPGTKFVTLGGAVAADVHGKNHNRAGGFGAHVTELEILLADNRTLHCSPMANPKLFRATLGGMGLTGIITRVAFKLRRIETPFVMVQHQPARDLEEALQLLNDAVHDDEYTVCWLDTVSKDASLGRGVFIRGHHASASELPATFAGKGNSWKRRALTVPIDLPSWLLNPLTAGLFNRRYYRKQVAKAGPFVADLDTFFYPLDAVNDWNRLYGRRGFVQYQCVLPSANAESGLREMLELCALSRVPSFLAVLKRFGAAGAGLLSFPAPGYSLALDFPVRAQLFELLRAFDEIVARSGGRVYLAKDACLEPEAFRRMYPHLPEWQKIKTHFDPDHQFCSDLSKRLGMCGELHHPKLINS